MKIFTMKNFLFSWSLKFGEKIRDFERIKKENEENVDETEPESRAI